MLLFLVLCGAPGFPAAAASPDRILVVGDSLSAGYGLSTSEGWVALLDARLAAQGYEYEVVNASVTGDTTRGGRVRIARALARHKPAIVIIELGGNDGLRGISISEMKDNLASMIDASAAAGARVLLLGMRIPPNYGPDYAGQFALAFDELAEEHGLPEPPFLLSEIALNDGLFQQDGIHPSAEAQPLLLDSVWPALSGLLRKPGC